MTDGCAGRAVPRVEDGAVTRLLHPRREIRVAETGEKDAV